MGLPTTSSNPDSVKATSSDGLGTIAKMKKMFIPIIPIFSHKLPVRLNLTAIAAVTQWLLYLAIEHYISRPNALKMHYKLQIALSTYSGQKGQQRCPKGVTLL